MKCLILIFILSFVTNNAFAVDTTPAPAPVPASSTEAKPSPSSLAPVTPTTTTPSSEPSPAPAPTPQPIIKSEQLNFNITNKDEICALFSFTGTIRLQAAAEPNENDTTVYLLKSTVATAESNCNVNATVLKLSLNGTADQLTLQLNHSAPNYELSEIVLTIGGQTYRINDTRIHADDTKSYLCQSDTAFKLNSTKTTDAAVAHLTLSNLHIDAFRTNKDNEFRQAIQCEADYPTNDFVPLAVGCALISLVLIVLIAYIVGRRRSKRLSYTSV